MSVANTTQGGFSSFAPPQQSLMQPAGHGQAGNLNQVNEVEKDPFLTLLEQLAENEHSMGGPSELDSYLSAADG